MSCHSIGHGLNSVSKKVLELYDEGKFEFSVAKDLLYTTRNAVHYCDGNTYEAIGCFDGCRCAICLKKTNDLYGLYDVLDECSEYYDIFSNKEDGVLSGDLCKDCFDEISEKYHSIIREDEVVY